MAATDETRLIVALEAKIDQFQKSLDRATGVTNTRMGQIEKRFVTANARISKSMTTAMSASVMANQRLIAGMSAAGLAAGAAASKINVLPAAMRGTTQAANGMGMALGSLGAYLGIQALTEYSNAWTRVTRSIDASGRVFGMVIKPATELNDLANDARIDVEAYTKTYIRTAAAIRDYGYDSETAAKVTSTLAKALKLGGASASEQASTILQFSQALQKGKLDGDEFRTVMENAGVIQELLAKRLNVTKGEIVKMAAAGKLQLPELIGAMVDGGAHIERIFKQMPATIDEAFSVLRNNVIRFVGEMDQANGASQAVAAGIVKVSKNLDILAVAMGAILGSVSLRLVAFSGAAVAAANPITLLAAAVGAAAVAYQVFGDDVQTAEGHIGTLKTSMQAFSEVAGEKIRPVIDAVTDLAATIDVISDKLNVSKTSWASWAQYVGYQILKIMPFSSQFATGWELARQAFGSFADDVQRRSDQIRAAQLLAGKDFGGGLRNAREGKLDYVPKPLSQDDPEAKRSKFEREIDHIRKRTEALQAELKVIGDTEFAQQKAKAAAELRFALDQTTAKEKRKATKEEIDSIETLSTAYAALGVKVAFLQKLQSMREGNEDLEAEIRLTGLYGAELEKARIQQELLVEAKRKGVEVTPQLQSEIDAIAERNAKLKETQQIIEETRTTARDALSGFIKDMRDGTSATESLGNALSRISDKLIDMGTNALVEAALGPLFGGGSTGGSSGGILGSILGLASGGKVAGPGTGTSDSVPARLSNGEFVVNAAATRKHQPLLEAINSGKMRSFAEGGPVSIPRVSVPSVAAAATSAPVSVTVAPTFNVANGSAEGVDKLRGEIVPLIKQVAEAALVNAFNRKNRFAKSGL